MKRCTKCNKRKSPCHFYADANTKDGLQYRCKTCDNAMRAANHLRYPIKRAARVAVSNALRDKRMLRQPCEKCGRKRVQAHHDDYNKPLDVRWLCKEHHREHHKRLTTTTK